MYYHDFNLLVTLLTIAIVMAVLLGVVAYLTLLERKVAAWVQDRIGPNRVGPLGLLQPIADGLKFLFKEEVIPRNVDKVFYVIAPTIGMCTALLAFAVVPFGRTTPAPTQAWPQTVEEARQAADPAFAQRVEAYDQTYQFVIAPHVDVGIVFIFAVSSLTVYGIILGGWSSNSKYSLIGSLRSSAQIISYEIPMGLSVLGVILCSHSLNLERIIDHQTTHGWNILFQPLAFVLFLTSIYAECNRLPFDLPEAEQELVAGYHTEYSALKFALFMLGEYVHVVTTSFLAVILFFGGWHLPGIAGAGEGGVMLKLIVFAAKMFAFILLYMLVRWTLPRFRFDQLMSLAWTVLIPLALANLVCVMVIVHLRWSQWLLLPASVAVLVGAGWVATLRPPAPPRTVRVIRGHEEVELVVR